MKSFARSGDLWSGLALAALGAYIVSRAWTWVYMGEDGPGAGFLPMWYGGAMVVLALVLVAGAVLKSPPREKRPSVRWDNVRRILTGWVAVLDCISLLGLPVFVISFV